MHKVKKQKIKKLTLKGYKDKLEKENPPLPELIAKICGVSKVTAYNWISGKFKVPLLAQEKINKHLGQEFNYEN